MSGTFQTTEKSCVGEEEGACANRHENSLLAIKTLAGTEFGEGLEEIDYCVESPGMKTIDDGFGESSWHDENIIVFDGGKSLVDTDMWCDVYAFAGCCARHDAGYGYGEGTRSSIGRTERAIPKDVNWTVDVEGVEVGEGNEEYRNLSRAVAVAIAAVAVAVAVIGRHGVGKALSA